MIQHYRYLDKTDLSMNLDYSDFSISVLWHKCVPLVVHRCATRVWRKVTTVIGGCEPQNMFSINMENLDLEHGPKL